MIKAASKGFIEEYIITYGVGCDVMVCNVLVKQISKSIEINLNIGQIYYFD